ncbi:(deoxy)nucleoside triphosphate pyrophosphohydrolase [Fusibacter tunisiensis]|uniref:8-oxo-dGTP diphosphatase n=1 Tax=Fusibacter tunisiensis TaxID=1008308 RepID=A0ABS2MU35_9FIRM|nr:(deoxy)nucleoside triphosphate pyrophosphohydrolase [Fusibacter tunisiensis]MBM7562865.1 8-oxo-dGTP diphosphatase [Fusibacter tunisiensis]
MKTIEVVAAAIVANGLVLCTQRGLSKHAYISHKFEFPGGKVEPGEKGSEALMRELKEELDLSIDITEAHYLMTVDHQYPDFRVIMHAYIIKEDEISIKLNEHIDHIWANDEIINTLDWASADVPIVDLLVNEGLIL